MRLYNTLTKNIDEFVPLRDNAARIYTCGPTVYDHAHIGNLSAFIFADTLRRTLQIAEFQTLHAMNYTDIDDKTIRRSQERYPAIEPRQALHQLTNEYIDIFMADMQRVGNDTDAINFLRATDHIVGMQRLITNLLKGNFAYIAEDGVYFSIEAYKNGGHKYGQLSQIDANRTSSARIANDEYAKEELHDFALWKKQKDNEPAWDFKVDDIDLRGRPGWHIECSAMSSAALGQPFDIHTGGVDLVFPHHENEIAQSTALPLDKRMAQYFYHSEHMLVGGRKMSKSMNNFYTLDDIISKGYDPLAFRLLVLQSHYRNQVNFTWESLDAAKNRLQNLRAMADLRWQLPPTINEISKTKSQILFGNWQHKITEQLKNDIGTPQALSILSEAVDTTVNLPFSEIDKTAFTDFLQFLDSAFGLQLMHSQNISTEQQTVIAQRLQARANKDWATSDQIRDDLAKQGIGLRDTDSTTIWHRL